MEGFSPEACRTALEKFLAGPARDAEEAFARAFSENGEVRLFFLSENRASTDGRDIVVDPAFHGIYRDPRCLGRTLSTLGWPPSTPLTPWRVLGMVSRGLVLHECLHLLFTRLPGRELEDPDFAGSANALQTIAWISNIVEDAYIEAAGASECENAAPLLKFLRVAVTHASEEEVPNESESGGKETPLLEYLEHMARFLLYPLAPRGEPSPAIRERVERSKPLFLAGSMRPDPDERYACCKEIFSLVADLVPPDEEPRLRPEMLSRVLPGQETHAGGWDSGGTPKAGRSQPVAGGLFDRDASSDIEKLARAIGELAAKEEASLRESRLGEGRRRECGGREVGAPFLHEAIRISEFRPAVDRGLRGAYRALRERHRAAIASGNARFLRLLRAGVPVPENRFRFGERLDSGRLCDPRGRCWVRKDMGLGTPELAVLVLVDGSGSMRGSPRENAVAACAILHEILRRQGIAHAIAEHRSAFEEPEMEVNVLVDFRPRREDGLNLLRLEARGDNRDGLALYWAERHLARHAPGADKLLVAITDGLPNHQFDRYAGAPAIRDTTRAARKIAARGTTLVAVALENGDGTEEAIRGIYPETVVCRRPDRLAGQLLDILSRKLK